MIVRIIAVVLASLLIVERDTTAECSRWIDVGNDGVGYSLDGPIWWQMPDHVVADAVAFEIVNGLWLVVEVEHGPGAPAVPSTFLDLTIAHQMLAIAVHSPGHDGSGGGRGGSFLVLTANQDLLGLIYGEPELPGMVTILYDDTGDCEQDGEFVMPMLGPIPVDCPVDAWIYSLGRDETAEQAVQAVADSYAAAVR
jgi:hypothetical protein